ncbi:MAG: hypothetical protein WA775_11225 [Psychroserpens sp.]|uniref:hypothetical protein n=1 Tax=Psychroserpens sp. TaxID=2020870 RepID=UPI003C797097
MTKFIDIEDYNGLKITLSVHHITALTQYEQHCEIELSTSKKLTTKLKLSELKALIG